MKIQFEKSGFSGGTRFVFRAQVDTEAGQLIYGAKNLQKKLSQNEAKALENLVKKTRFFSLPARLGTARGREAETFSITLETDGKSHTVSGQVDQSEDIPQEIRPLYDRLLALSRGQVKD